MTTHKEAIDARLTFLQIDIDNAKKEMQHWEYVKIAAESEKEPDRHRMAVQLLEDDYIATYRWEINPDNGWLTVQLQDGSILPTQLGKWCPYYESEEFFGVERRKIIIDDPQKDTVSDTDIKQVEDIPVGCLHEWWVYSYSASLTVPSKIMVQCRHCGVLGSTEHYTTEEWKKAYNSPVEPFLWEGTVENATRRSAKLAEGIPQ